MNKSKESKSSRRDFLVESGKTALAAGLIGASVGQAQHSSSALL